MIVVLGAYKCGSTSLVNYLKYKYPNQTVKKAEKFFYPDYKLPYGYQDEDIEWWVIIRKNVDDFYHSWHEFFCFTIGFEEFMKLDNLKNTGYSAKELGDFDKFINLWKTKIKNIKVVYLEDMIKKCKRHQTI